LIGAVIGAREVDKAKFNLSELVKFISRFLELFACIFQFLDLTPVLLQIYGSCADDLIASLGISQCISESIFRDNLSKKQVLNIFFDVKFGSKIPHHIL